jgi:hypothetical protein
MMTRKGWIYITVAICLLQSFALIGSLKETAAIEDKYGNELRLLETQTKVLSQRVQLFSDVSQISSILYNSNLITLNGKAVKFSEVFPNRVVVLRISASHCEQCVVAQLPFFKKLLKTLGKDKAIILGSFPSLRLMKMYIAANDLPEEIFLTPPDAFSSLSIETLSAPYYFTVNEGKLTNVFIPEKQLPQLTENYINNLIENLKQ